MKTFVLGSTAKFYNFLFHIYKVKDGHIWWRKM